MTAPALKTEEAAAGGLAEAWAEEDLAALHARGLRRHLEPLTSPQGPVIRLGPESLVNFSSNDYLGLAADERLSYAATRAMAHHGVGSGASRLIVGDSTAHQSLEHTLARFMGSEAALVFNSGYAANVGVLSALVGTGDVIFSDALNHASLIDGTRLSRAKKVIYPHRDLAALERLLETTPGRRRLVVTDSVFSMDGDVAPIVDLLALCREHDCALMVDEAHAIGVFGPHGAGMCAELGLEGEVDLRVGTLGKSLGSFGAFAAASAPVRELLFNRARSFVFSTSLPAAVCAASEAAVDIVRSEPSLRDRLWRNIRRFAEGLRALGVPAEAQSAIFPVVLGEPEAALEASRLLRTRGLLVKPIRPPTVPEGTSRLRFALSAGHTDQHIDLALELLRELFAKTR